MGTFVRTWIYIGTYYLVFRQGKKKKKKSGESSTSTTTTNNFDGGTDSDESSNKKNNTLEGASSSATQPKNISELNPYDLDEYLGPVWEAETSTGNGPTQQLPVPVQDPLPVLNTIDLGVLMESDEETLLETVIRLSGQDKAKLFQEAMFFVIIFT